MEINNLKIAELLRKIAICYSVLDEKKHFFRISAYERAADSIEYSSKEIRQIWKEGELDKVAGIGRGLSKYLDELFRKGRSMHFDKLLSKVPEGVFELMKVEGVGPKSAYKIIMELKLEKKKDIFESVEKAANKGEIAKLDGFGEKSEREILKGIESLENRKEKGKRMLLSTGLNLAEGFVGFLKEDNSVKSVDVLGSLRRKMSTVGDIDISVITSSASEVIERFCKYNKVTRVLDKGDKKASVVIDGLYRVDLMVQDEDSYGSLLVHFTGSKNHNIALREYARRNRMSVSEYGIKNKGKIEKFKNEKGFYKYLKMEWIPPELREDGGEIEAALEKKLPELVKLLDIKGDLHIHSNFDIETSHDLGTSGVGEIVDEAVKLGYKYIGFSDHSPSVSNHTQRDVLELLKRRKEYIDKESYSFVKSGKIRVFNMLEVDIMADGSLSINDKCMDFLDGVIASIHSSFRQKRAQMTKRVVSALSHPRVKIIGHPTGRLLGEREGYDLNWDEVFDRAVKNDKAIEINGYPMRLDLVDYLVKEAVGKGVKLVIGSDSHDKWGLFNMRYGVYVGRRGWAEKADILNCMSYNKFKLWLNS